MNGKKANVATFPLGFPLLVFGISLAFTAAVTGYLRRSIQRRDADRFVTSTAGAGSLFRVELPREISP